MENVLCAGLHGLLETIHTIAFQTGIAQMRVGAGAMGFPVLQKKPIDLYKAPLWAMAQCIYI